VLKIWAKRHRDLSRARTQVACRLHAVLCELVPGGVSKEAAFTIFQSRVGHVPPGQLPATMAVLLRPGTVLAPGPYRDLMQRLSGNWEYLTRFEMQSFIRYLPDLDLIAASRIPVALAAGTDTIALAERADLRHDPFHRPCTAIAARLGAEFAEFPGGHLAPMELPAPFAAGLRDVFGRL